MKNNIQSEFISEEKEEVRTAIHSGNHLKRERGERKKKVSVSKELRYKTGDSQPTRIRSKYARIDLPA